MTPRAKARLLLLLLALGLGYRLFAAYPLQLERFAPASSALQAMHILHGERPIFYSGQAWMGPAGAYIIAAMFKLFGASTLTLGAFSWLVSALFLVGTVLLARRLFGVDNALVAAALFAVPVDYLMNLSGQPRAHYTITFALVPAVFLATLALVRRHDEGRPLALAALGLGLLAGFSFWTNMAIGPAIAISMLLLLWRLRRTFFTRALAPWLAGWVIGFWPVIWYNLTNRAVLGGQVNADNTRRLGQVLKAFVTNAWPRFWGVDLSRVTGQLPRALLIALLVWLAALYAWALIETWRRWRRGEDVLGQALVFGYFALHLAVTSFSSYGSRFETSTPLSYVGPLYAVAFLVPGLILQSRLSSRGKALALAPLCLLVLNNLAANAHFARTFTTTVRERGLSQVVRYPNEANPFVQAARAHRLEAGYLGRGFKGDSAKYQNFLLNLEGFGLATFSDPSAERYVQSALAADAAREIFWIGADPAALRTAGVAWKEEPVQKWPFFSDFRKKLRETAVIAARPAGPAQAGPAAVLDANYDTAWSADAAAGPESSLEFAFERPERLREVVLFPKDIARAAWEVQVEVSDDGQAWRAAGRPAKSVPMFWSVAHPFLKAVKPRLEIVLPWVGEARFCRLRFTAAAGRGAPAIREVLLLADGPLIEPDAWKAEIGDIVRTVWEKGRDNVVTGDHWFVDFFRREGFATDFISNESVDNNGLPNPNLPAPVPVDFSRAQLLIVPRPYLGRAERLLRSRGVAFIEAPLRYHTVLQTAPTRVDPPLFWNGLELDELARASR